MICDPCHSGASGHDAVKDAVRLRAAAVEEKLEGRNWHVEDIIQDEESEDDSDGLTTQITDDGECVCCRTSYAKIQIDFDEEILKTDAWKRVQVTTSRILASCLTCLLQAVTQRILKDKYVKTPRYNLYLTGGYQVYRLPSQFRCH